jgi:hypothetical protein
MVGLPCLLSQCAKLHVAGWKGAVSPVLGGEVCECCSVERGNRGGMVHAELFVGFDLENEDTEFRRNVSNSPTDTASYVQEHPVISSHRRGCLFCLFLALPNTRLSPHMLNSQWCVHILCGYCSCNTAKCHRQPENI